MGLLALEQTLIENRILPTLAGLWSTEKHRCFLVGGALRDALQNRPSRDFDFTTSDDPTDLARCFAGALGGHWFMLDARHHQSRVVFSRSGHTVHCDFGPFRAPDISGDLTLRDFTINAMAVPILADGRLGPLQDPLGGRQDLRRGLLRHCSAKVLFDDPLRVLKGLRHCLCLQLSIAPDTLTAMRSAAPGLEKIAAERLRGELAAMLSVTPARRGLLLLQELNLLPLLGSPARSPYQRGMVFLERAEQWLEWLCRGTGASQRQTFFQQELEQGISRALVFKLAAWFFGQGILDATPILQALRCGRTVQHAVRSLLAVDASRIQQFVHLPALGRNRALWAEDLGSHSRLVLYFLGLRLPGSLAARTKQVVTMLDDLDRYQIAGKVPSLVSGRWLQQALQLEGKGVGQRLAALRQAEIAGRVLTREQAEEFLRSEL